MMDNQDSNLIDEMFIEIRRAEVRNEKLGKYDDKTMVAKISKYILDMAKKEVEKEEENEV